MLFLTINITGCCELNGKLLFESVITDNIGL